MDFLRHARRFADALLQHGMDRYGPVHTPLFCHMIDLETLAIPAQHTAAEWRTLMAEWEEDRGYLMWGKDRSNLTWAHQSNLLWDADAVRLLHRLSDRTGDPRYRAAAEAYLSYFLEHCVSTATGLFAWGEHVAYNVETDRVEGERHELQRHDAPWEELWPINPDAVRREIEAVYRCHVVDHDAMIYDRHARYRDGLPERDRATIMGYAGVFACAWAFLWKKTGDGTYLDWGRRQLLAFQTKADADGLYPDNWTDSDMREQPRLHPPRMHLALTMLAVYDITGDIAWLDDACRYARACVRAIEQGQPDGSFGSDAAMSALTLVAAFRDTGDRWWLDQAEGAGQEIANRPTPRTQMASHVADRLQTFLDLYRATADEAWLAEATRVGEYAVSAFVHPSGFIRGTAIVKRRDYYDAIQGPGTLAWQLQMLGEAVERRGAGVMPEAARIVETPPVAPSIGEPTRPSASANTVPADVQVEIRHPAGIARAILHYAVGYRVGLVDDHPRVGGHAYAFTIPAPEGRYEGPVTFAVEAWSAGASPTRSISPWYRFAFVTDEIAQADVEGTAVCPGAGVRLAGLTHHALVGVRAEAGMPSHAADLPAPWQAAPRARCVDARPIPGATITIAFAEGHVDRLVAEELRLARWDGAAWRISEDSTVDPAARTVTAPYDAPGVWAIAGARRIRWQAAQREACPTVIDIDGDGRREVVLTQWVNGEVLDHDGTSRFVVRMAPSNRPVQNTSSPAVADIDGDGRLELVFGATSGHVHVTDTEGRERWKAEVGGEVRGGIVVTRLPGEATSIIAVAWHDGGVAVVNADGRVRWQRRLPRPVDVTPVLCDAMPGGPALLAAAGDEVVALRCADGSECWRASLGGHPVAPAVGEIERGGPARVVVGDATGRLTLLDLAGGAVASWQAPYTHDAYRAITEVGMADLCGLGRRQIIAATAGGLVWAYEADGTPVWQFTSREQEMGIALGVGGRLAFADLVGDGTLCSVVAEQDRFIYVLDPNGRKLWEFRGAFLYHYSPVVADLDGEGELTIITTSPCQNGTYALRAGGGRLPPASGTMPWPTMRGNFGRTNCAPWIEE